MIRNQMILIAGSAFLVAAMVLAGCLQDTGGQGPDSGTQAPAPTGTQGRYGGPRFQPNLTAAADKLGVSQEQLEAALNMTVQGASGRMNLTSAAGQLGVTRQQLADALGFQFNASRGQLNGSRQRPGPGTTT